MKFKKIVFLFVFGCLSVSFSQEQYANELSFVSDNDLYISTYKDRYYTNGMFLSYRFLSSKIKKKPIKKIYEIQLGHHIYTPYRATVSSVLEHDRPFAGYLFGGFSVTNFYKDNFVKFATQIGVLGKAAKGEELMEVVHNVYGFNEATGWKYQIKNTFALNLEASYTKLLTISNDKKVDVYWQNNAQIGTIFTNFSTGFYTRIGFKPLQDFVNSIAFNSNLNNKNTSYVNNSEFFLYLKPSLSLIAYDATITGSLFRKNSPVTYKTIPVKFTAEVGVKFTVNKFNFGYAVFYHTKKLKSVQVPNSNFYGSIQINYLFR